MRLLTSVLLSVLIVRGAFAQEKACPLELPVGMVDNNGTLLEGLTPKDMSLRFNKQNVAIESVKYDKGPRRVLVILDTGSRLPLDARKAETMLLNHIVARARAEDSFALLTARGPLRKVHFGEGKDAILKAAQELASDPKEPVKGENILDTIAEGVEWFGEPRTGDAILVMADHLEESNESSEYTSRQISGIGPSQGIVTDRGPSFEKVSRMKFSAVVKMLGERRIRVFGLQLGILKTNIALTSKYSANDENLFGISLGSGGYAVFDPVDPFGSYVLNDTRAQALQNKIWQLYGSISQFYLVQVQAPSSRGSWKLELAKDLRSTTHALYPQLFGLCPAENPR
jgi:hypothetical protein